MSPTPAHTPAGTGRTARALTTLSATFAAALILTACGESGDDGKGAGSTEDKKPAKATEPLVATYDGGLHVLDGKSLKVVEDIPLKGFNRVNPAGDDRHVVVSTSKGFQLLDAGAAELTDVEFPGAEPGHVVRHAGKTVLFTDGTGEITIFDPEDLGDGKPETTSHTSKSPHHGVAVELANGELVTTLGDKDGGTGITVLNKDREEVTRSEDCPGVHGEATAKGEAVVIGCQDGVLLYRDGKIKKIDSPDEYGRIGNQAGSDDSPVVLGDYKTDEDAELERPERVALINTETGKLKLVDLGTSYSFRSLARGPHGEGLVLGTDGKLHTIDPDSGEVTKSLTVTDEWREPLDWQQARPTLFVRDHTAYVTEPEKKKLHTVDLESGEKTRTASLPSAPNEISGVDLPGSAH
ncbi:hypothetical protein E0L36_16600 [Streptomyces sp. AJS327]|uniref:zinc metallochaperone AztD n=1 Tax=Streptomyces sp. AJS327 TaxID=2545265 RepID=UPI0017995C0E|nr:zinc metallochaperone AztD [Streptomyces sp. AJS327]MBA0052474.1 hypothetical protein [Streptomyces sp. AJS327]